MKNDILKNTLEKFIEIVEKHNLSEKNICVKTGCLTPEEAIGNPERKDYPIIEGKEQMIQADFMGSKGQSFTDSPSEFCGTLHQVLNLDITVVKNRAVVIAVMNAVLRYFGYSDSTVHCKNEEPEKCSKEIASLIAEKYGKINIGIIGLNPSILEALSKKFGDESLKITDLNREQIGKIKYGVEIWDGREKTEELVKCSELILITGTTLINNSLNNILELVEKYKKDYFIYGTTIAGAASLLNLKRICFFGSNS